jgi:hypothetical protein
MADARRPHEEPVHDVLAAEAFAMPIADRPHHGPIKLPEDPTGIPEPHDILAAEEFAMPAAEPHPAVAVLRRTDSPLRLPVLAGLALLALVLLLHRRRHR